VLFLQTWRASIIPLIAVPVSVVGTFAVMLAAGFSINALSLSPALCAVLLKNSHGPKPTPMRQILQGFGRKIPTRLVGVGHDAFNRDHPVPLQRNPIFG
jgi:multidrug efflux pump subunit AcrB